MNTLKFKSLLQFAKHFSDDQTCRQHLEKVIWHNQPKCPHCQTEKPYRLADGKIFKCREPECKKKFTVATGTIFQGTMLSLPKWFAAIYFITSHKKGISSIQLGKDVGMTQKTAWFVLQRIRSMMQDESLEQLSNIVEMDETYIGGKSGKGTQGRSTKSKTPVIGIIERQGKLKTQVVKDASSKTIDAIIAAKVSPDATIVTDGWNGYGNVKKTHEHWKIDHNKGQYVVGKIHTNTIEGFWSLLKRGIIGIYHQVSVKHLHRYCAEFEFRYNTKSATEFERFNLAITQTGRKLRYQDLIR